MAHWKQDLEELCEKIVDEISEANKKLDKNGGNLTAGDVETLDKLTHTLKSIKTTLAMAEFDDDYSGEGSYNRGGGGGGRGGSSNRGGSYRGSYEGGMSNARGRRRDGRGRYSRDEAVDEIADAIREGMDDMPEELKREAKRFLTKLESM